MGENHVGFNSEKMFVAAAHLSVILNLNHFDEVELVTDQRGKELFIDKWNIPFTNVVVCLDKLNHINSHHWAIGKLEACSIQTEPFMHQDLDVFWFKKPPSLVYESDVCFQNLENDRIIHGFYLELMHHANDFFEKKKPFVDYSTINAVNCGIMAFNDLSVINDWYAHAMEYIEYHDRTGGPKDSVWNSMTSLVFEQVHLYYFLKNAGIDMSFLSMGTKQDHYFLSQSRANELGYTHLISSSKRNKNTEDLLMSKISRVDPQFYKKLLIKS